MNSPEASPQNSSRPLLIMRAIKAYRQGRLGDVAAYKAAIFRTNAYPHIAKQLANLETYFPQIDLNHLKTLAEGSFGKSYAQHMERYNLTPLKISPQVTAQLRDNILGLRYTLTHDIFHVLLGYDTSLQGELAVWSFVGEQHYSPTYEIAATFAAWVYPCFAPHQYRQFKAIAAQSRAIAQQAPCLIAQPFEKYWSDPLEDVRSQFGLPIKHDFFPIHTLQ